MHSEIQSILINKKYFSFAQACDWIKKHHFNLIKVDITHNFYRFRQTTPTRYKYFRTISLAEGIEAVVGFK